METMVSERKDFLPICNDQRTPLELFKQMFCDRCMQPECTRSKVGLSKFEKRVSRWYDDYFADVPKLDSSDPRYSLITAQKFITLDTGPIPEIQTSSWVDPRDLAEAKPPVALPTPPAAPVEAAPKIPQTTFPRINRPLNTPNQGPRMLGGAPAPTAVPAPATDPWGTTTTPAESSGTETVVTPGTTIKFGNGV